MSVEIKTAPTLLTETGGSAVRPHRSVMSALVRGALCKCPACGNGALFDGYLTVAPGCTSCGEPLHHHRADDAPPYFTITIVGHIIIPALLAVEVLYRPALWIHMAVWLPLTLILALVFLRPVKGALVGLQWALYMHGFGGPDEEDLVEPDPAAHHRL